MLAILLKTSCVVVVLRPLTPRSQSRFWSESYWGFFVHCSISWNVHWQQPDCIFDGAETTTNSLPDVPLVLWISLFVGGAVSQSSYCGLGNHIISWTLTWVVSHLCTLSDGVWPLSSWPDSWLWSVSEWLRLQIFFFSLIHWIFFCLLFQNHVWGAYLHCHQAWWCAEGPHWRDHKEVWNERIQTCGDEDAWGEGSSIQWLGFYFPSRLRYSAFVMLWFNSWSWSEWKGLNLWAN